MDMCYLKLTATIQKCQCHHQCLYPNHGIFHQIGTQVVEEILAAGLWIVPSPVENMLTGHVMTVVEVAVVTAEYKTALESVG